MKIRIKKNTWIKPEVMRVGWGNGYVHIPKTHPLYGKGYDEIDVDVHGGLTYAEKEGESWVVGFDTAHYGDNEENCSKAFVIKETKKLRNQLIKLGLSKN